MNMIYAIVICSTFTNNQCQLTNGVGAYHQSLEVCESVISIMNQIPDAKPGYPNRLWYECWEKEVPAWRPIR